MKITFVIGGARSGKSSFALREASKIEGQKAFVATAEVLDDEMKDRIEKHRTERGGEWNTFEEPLRISGVLSDLKDKFPVIVVDCLTIWLSNVLLQSEMAVDRQRLEETILEFTDKLQELNSMPLKPGTETRCFMVSNEVGLGIVPENKLSRQFRDLAGALNQKVAEIADEVYLVTAGIPMKIKG
jgi:adenosylcobinamide kinase/adenosylcobinamide-phosphate guanylyltransferase